MSAKPSGPTRNRLPQRRVLMLAYYFPPLGGGGVQRTLKHVKYLPDHGYAPIVLTTRLGLSPIRDPTLATEVPAGTTVIRAPEIPLQLLKWGLDGALRRAGLPTTVASYVGWPDELAGWMPAAAWYAIRAVRRYRPEVLYSTSSPVSAHLVALLVKRATGIPWVADFRDAWTQNPDRERLAKPASAPSAWLERAVVGRADHLVVVDDSIELLGVDANDPRFVVIRNGVDPDDLPPVDARARGERFRIAYVGTLYGARNAAPVFAALRALIDQGVIEREKLELRIVGPAALDADPNLQRLPVSHRGYSDHGTALSEMVQAEVLLFYAHALQRGPSGKIYEYLVTGRPILCVAPSDNFAFRLVEQLDAGTCADPRDQPAIERAIEHLYRRWQRSELAVSPEIRTETLRRFSRPALAGQLATVLDAAAGLRPPALRMGPHDD